MAGYAGVMMGIKWRESRMELLPSQTWKPRFSFSIGLSSTGVGHRQVLKIYHVTSANTENISASSQTEMLHKGVQLLCGMISAKVQAASKAKTAALMLVIHNAHSSGPGPSQAYLEEACQGQAGGGCGVQLEDAGDQNSPVHTSQKPCTAQMTPHALSAGATRQQPLGMQHLLALSCDTADAR